MRRRLSLVLSATALAVALLGSTPLSRAAADALEQVVPRAKTADFAKNAGKLNGRTSSMTPRARQIPVLNARGKLPASIGAVGPRGPAGPTGAAGAPGVSGYQVHQEVKNLRTSATTPDDVACPGGKTALAGGHSVGRDEPPRVLESRPFNNTTWRFRIESSTAARNNGLTLYVVCANVG
jgi:hypothetical protein